MDVPANYEPTNIREMSKTAITTLAKEIESPFKIVGNRLKCTMCSHTALNEKDKGLHLKRDHKVERISRGNVLNIIQGSCLRTTCTSMFMLLTTALSAMK